MPRMIEAVLWDFGGVILSSPFEAFNRYESEQGLPTDFLRRVNATNPDSNAWARLERNEIGPAEFDIAFAADSAALGHEVRGADVLALLSGDVRPEMVLALDAVKAAGYRTACLTNNVVGGVIEDGVLEGGPASAAAGASVSPSAAQRSSEIAAIMARFDVVVESSKVGIRKPETRFYEIACELLGVEPASCVFLDDLGINLKPAAAMGMTTIKVLSAEQAITDLEQALGIALR